MVEATENRKLLPFLKPWRIMIEFCCGGLGSRLNACGALM